MSLIQTDALYYPLQEVRVARLVIDAANAGVADIDAVLPARATTAPCHATLVAASAEDDTLTINFPATLGATPVGNVSFVLDANTSDALSVSGVDATGVVTIKLANADATKNTAALITAAIAGLTPTGEGATEGKINGIDISGVVCVAANNWDTAAIAESSTTDMTDVQCEGGDGEYIYPDVFPYLTQPPRCCNITATAGGTTATDIGAVSVTIYGTNIDDQEISETLPAFTANTAATKAGSKAFKTITKVHLPSHDGTGATVSIGYGEVLGVPFMFSVAPYCKAFLGGTLESTAPSQSVDTDEIEKNTIDLSSNLNGSEVEIIYFLP